MDNEEKEEATYVKRIGIKRPLHFKEIKVFDFIGLIIVIYLQDYVVVQVFNVEIVDVL